LVQTIASMKTKFIFLYAFCAFAVQTFAQLTEKQGLLGYNAAESAQILKDENALILRQYNGQFFASIDGKVYDMRQSGRFIHGNVKYASDGIVVIETGLYTMPDVAVKNYRGNDATIDNRISVCAIQTGTYDWNDVPLKLWDCGKPYVPPPLTPEQIKAAQDAAKITALREKQKQFLAQSNAVVWLQSEATNGDVSAQCSLGEHYLNGQGCETNRDLAIQWLQKASDGGSVEASNKLSQLK